MSTEKMISIIPKNPSMNRLSFLPAYPSLDRFHPTINRDHLLLSNTARQDLTLEQQRRRDYHTFHQPFTLIDQSNDIYVRPFFIYIYQHMYGNLIQRCHVNDAILDYNYEHLRQCLTIMIQEYIRYGLLSSPSTVGSEQLRIDEYAFALEFFLQFDIDLFFMKTCTFRQAQPTLYNHHGIYCIEPAQAIYGMTPCRQLSCRFCFPIHHSQQQQNIIVQFSATQRYRFHNGYEVILNCPTVCSTENILYVLTCTCKQYEFIGYTKSHLMERLQYHRELSHQTIREFLLDLDQKTKSIPVHEILLYKHIIQCSSALQLFLNANPHYWHFIPMQSDDLTEVRSKAKHDLHVSNMNIDFFTATILIVLPENCSNLFYQFIETLFITHAQTKLNLLGHLDGYSSSIQLETSINDPHLFQKLTRPTLLSVHHETKQFSSHRLNPHFQ